MRDRPNQPRDPRTLAVHAGERPDPATRASSPNLVMSATFVTDPDIAFSAERVDADSPFTYSRWSNPTVNQMEAKLAALEGAPACVAFASGMAALGAVPLDLLNSGDHLVTSDVAYAGFAELATDLLSGLGVRVTRVDTSDLEAVRDAITPDTRLVHVETPCNPIVRLTDIAAVTEIAHAAGAKVMVDSTFATPSATRPLELGADYVVHSLTKYLGGHGDALGGAVLGSREDLLRLRQRISVHLGGVPSPFNAWLIMRGMATLPIRMRAHEEGALQVARFLETHPRIERVIYPGLESHPQHALAKRQMENFSGMMTFRVADGAAAARALSERLEIIHYAVSLGHHRSLVVYLPTGDMLANSFVLDDTQAAAYRAWAGDGVFRLSVGIESPRDLIRDLEQALE